jgi:hypothetical protein
MLRHLNNFEMAAITTQWATHPEAKATFLSIAEIAAYHPKIVKANLELLAIQPAPTEQSPTMQKLIVELAKTDEVHDALARVISSGIEADRLYCLAAKPPQPERASQAEKVYIKVFPTGMAIVNASYLAEFGNTARVATLLQVEPAVAEHLEAIPVRDDGDLLQLTKRWITAGTQLRKLEHERDALTAKDTTKPVNLATITAVRSRWLRLVSQIP